MGKLLGLTTCDSSCRHVCLPLSAIVFAIIATIHVCVGLGAVGVAASSIIQILRLAILAADHTHQLGPRASCDYHKQQFVQS